MRRALVALALAAGLALAVAPASGAVTIARDAQGRAIRIDVRAPGAKASDYARILRNSIHGDEISDVTVIVLPEGSIGQACGSVHAGGCYGVFRGRARIQIPASSPGEAEAVLLHEYGHHIDRARSNGDIQEPNGTPRWWSARAMGARVRRGEVAPDYRRGWSHAIGEIFAEDYVQLQVKAPYRIRWLPPPSAAVMRAMRLDLTGRGGGPAPRLPAPLITTRSGTLSSGDGERLPFGLLGPGRKVGLVAHLGGTSADRARAEVVCNGRVIGSQEAGGGEEINLDLGPLGPAECTANLVGTAGAAHYDMELTLTRVT